MENNEALLLVEQGKGSRNDNLSLDNVLSLSKPPLQSSLLREMAGMVETMDSVLALWEEHLNEQGTLDHLLESVESPSGSALSCCLALSSHLALRRDISY